MSRSRGLIPLALATTFGILNGVSIFGPAFQDQERAKLEKKQKESEAAESAGLPEAPKATDDGRTMTGAEAPTARQQLDSAAPENASWWSVFRLGDRAKSASKAEEAVGGDGRAGDDPHVRKPASTDSSGK